jgi:ABC-type glycerol-3-phosphate transport system substrate-binding protein
MNKSGLWAVLVLGTALSAPIFDAQAQTSTACPNGVTKLTGLRSQNAPPYEEVIQKWKEANPCVDVAFSDVPFSQLADKISVLATSRTPPDIIVYDGPNTQSYAAAGILLPLDEYLPAGFKEDVLPATLEEHSYKGKVYSPGIEQATLGLYYNKDLTDKLGINPPQDLKDAWTWPQALEAFKKCQQGPAGAPTVWGLGPTRFGNGQPGLVYRDLLFSRSAGDPKAPKDSSAYKTFKSISDDGATVDGYINSPESIEALKFFKALFNEEGGAPKAGITNSFIDGKACFYIDTSAVGNALLKDPKIRWGLTPFPYFKTPIVHTGSTTIGATARSANPKLAAKFVVDMSTGEYVRMTFQKRGNMPTLKSLLNTFTVYQEYPMKTFIDQLSSWGQPRPPGPKFAQYDKLVSDALRDIALGADPKETMDGAVRKVDAVLQR